MRHKGHGLFGRSRFTDSGSSSRPPTVRQQRALGAFAHLEVWIAPLDFAQFAGKLRRARSAQQPTQGQGAIGRGDSWRARLLFLRPGDLTDPKAMGAFSDEALFQLIKHGGSSFGKPGMPSFGFHLSDEEILALVTYLRPLAVPSADGRPQS